MKSFGWILILLLCTVNLLATSANQDLLISSEKFSFSDLKEHGSDHARKLTAAPEEITVAKKGQKGKGAYGGANVVHRRPGEKSAASVLLHNPFFFIFSAIIGFTFTLS